MLTLDTLRPMTMEPYELVGWVIRESLRREGVKPTHAAGRWPLSLPTLNRMLKGQPVGLTFYRVAEKHLGLPWRFFDHIIDGDVAAVRAAEGVDAAMLAEILTEMNGDNGAPTPIRRRRSR